MANWRSPSWVPRLNLGHRGDIGTTNGKSVYWVGASPLRSPDAAADMVFLNSSYKAKAEAIGASFVDVSDGFADDDGQMKSLRASDGIDFHKAGLRKLGLYVEQDIGQHGGFGLWATAPTARNAVSGPSSC